jgi:hypothetical protein
MVAPWFAKHSIGDRYEEQQRQRSIAALKRRAAALGFDINPTPAPA